MTMVVIATPRDIEAVARLHSFWWEAASKAFHGVAEQGPSCPMAHWGVAMTSLGNPLAWPPNPKALQEGGAAIENAKAIGGNSPREPA